MYNIEDLTEQARRSGASDIHLVCGLPPKYRLDGQLENMADFRGLHSRENGRSHGRRAHL